MTRTRRRPTRRRTAAIVIAAALAAGLAPTGVEVGPAVAAGAAAAPVIATGTPAAGALGRAPARRPSAVSITVLSGRADLVSGGSALVAVTVPRTGKVGRVTMTVGRRSVTKAFTRVRRGRYVGLVRGLRVGTSIVRAVLPDGRGARITLTNHPRGGPVFSGPQLKPWVCQATARDAQCNEPAKVTYLYKSRVTGAGGLRAYDPKNPPSDVATTRVNGRNVPFIVRNETGYLDRDQYSISALYQPGKPWNPATPQHQYARKLLVTHGSSCGVEHTTGTAPSTTGPSTGASDAAAFVLGAGWVVMSTALDNSGHNCNLAVQAEALVMAKELVVKRFGTLRYTIGTGCSGGSLAEQWVANAYPGFYQGLLPTCSFPDAYTTATQFLDYHLLLAYFTDPGTWDVASGVAWLPTQMADVLGGTDGLVNAEVSETAQFHVAVPTDPCAGVTGAQRYEPASNPGGTRCTVQDAAINMFGPQEERFWGTNEKLLGRGFARLPIDNVGVQYGLETLMAGTITPAQFVDLNVKAGGVDIDANPTAARFDNGRSASLANAYRTGLINEANNLDQVPIIDCRGTNPGIFHDVYRAFAIRKRLDEAHGTHANQVIWEGPVPLLADSNCEIAGLTEMNRWLDSITQDHRAGTLAQKVIRNKPASVTDRCYSGTGQKLTDTVCPDSVVSVEGTPRTVAGDSIATDANKCQLQPLDRADYASLLLPFTDAQWAQLTELYPTGVCDFTKKAVFQRGAIAWMTYQDARGKVIYGGRPLGAAPASTPVRARR